MQNCPSAAARSPLQIPTESLQTFTRESDTFLEGEGLSHWEPNSSPELSIKFRAKKSDEQSLMSEV
jgi:hypothetical protein